MKTSFRLLDLVTLRRVSSLLSGNYRTSFHGSGIEFSDIREYAHGDDVRDIDWKTSARTARTFIKKYEEERELKTLFLLDASASMRFGLTTRTKFDTLSEILSILAYSSLENGDPVGAWFFDRSIREILPETKGARGFSHLEAAFSRNRAAGVDSETPLGPVFEELLRRKIRNRLIFLCTDSLETIRPEHLRAVASTNDLILIHVFDRYENTLEADTAVHAVTPGVGLTVSPADHDKILAYQVERTRELENFRSLLLKSGASYLLVDDRTNPYDVLYRFFKVRQGRF